MLFILSIPFIDLSIFSSLHNSMSRFIIFVSWLFDKFNWWYIALNLISLSYKSISDIILKINNEFVISYLKLFINYSSWIAIYKVSLDMNL